MKNAPLSTHIRPLLPTLPQRFGWLGALVVSGAMAHGQMIAPDGRTATSVQTQGRVTNVTTGTVRGTTGFNSFSRFNVDAGSTVNLHLAAGTENLINLVHGDQSVINGVLNSMKDGKLGGKMYLANPNGVVVGKSGVINTGGLTLATPTKEFMDSMLGLGGDINDGAVARFMAGDFPLSPSGLVSVQGKINASEDVAIRAGNVEVTGSITTGPKAGKVGQLSYGNIVNVRGAKSGTGLVVRGGNIEIVAAGSARVKGGKLTSTGARNVRAGQATIKAGGDVEFSNAMVNVSGADLNSQGGALTIQAGGNLALANSKLLADAGTTGDGGTIHLGAANDITAGAGVIVSASAAGVGTTGGTIMSMAERDAKLGTGALFRANGGTRGAGGFVEFSGKNHVTIDGGQLSARSAGGTAGTALVDPETLELNSDASSNGTSLIYQADRSITVAAGITISTRMIAAGGDMLTSPSIGNSGDITMEAPIITIRSGARLLSHADGAFTAGNITLDASQTASGVSGISSQVAITDGLLKGGKINLLASKTTVVGKIDDIARDELLPGAQEYIVPILEFGLSSVYANPNATASVSLLGNTVIDSSVSTTIEAIAEAKGSAGLPKARYFNAAWVHTESEASVYIDDAVRLTSEGAVTIDAKAKSETSAVAESGSIGSDDPNASQSKINLTIAVGQTDSHASINMRGTIDAKGTVSLGAATEDIIDVTSASNSHANGVIGLAFTISTRETLAEVKVDGTVSGNTGVNILATNNPTNLNGTFTHTISAGGGLGPQGLVDKIEEKTIDPIKDPIKDKIKSLFSSKTKDASGIDTSAGSSDIGIGGAVAIADEKVRAEVTVGSAGVVRSSSGNISIKAESRNTPQVSSASKVSSPGQAAKDFSVAGALAIGNFKYESKVRVDGTLNALGSINLESRSLMPSPTSIRFDELKDFLTNPPEEVANPSSLTAIKDGTSQIGDKLADTIGLAFTTRTKAATVDTGDFAVSGSLAIQDFTINANTIIGSTARINQTASGPAAAGSVTALAHAGSTTFHFGGPNKISANEGAEAGIGGTYLGVNVNGNALAKIESGAQVTANTLMVDARNENKVIAIATNGSVNSGKFSITGGFGNIDITDKTIAQIDDGATIRAGATTVRAVDDSQNYVVAGNLARGVGGTSIGFTLGLGENTRETRALIGNLTGEAVGNGAQTFGALTLEAKNTGRIFSTSIAATQAGTRSPAAGVEEDTSEADSGASSGSAGIRVSGSAALLEIVESATAEINGGATIVAESLTGTAKSDADMFSITGGLLLDTSSESRAGLAGAFAKNDIESTTRVNIAAPIKAGSLTLAANQDADIFSLAAGLNGSPGSNGIQVAGSVTINQIENITEALLSGQNGLSLTGPSSILAKDDSDIKSIAGAVTVGGKVAFGGAVGFNKTTNKTAAKFTDSTITLGSALSITALNDSSIHTLAAAGAFTNGAAAIAGSVTYNKIGNQTTAEAARLSLGTGAGSLFLDAGDKASIKSLAGGLAFGGSAGIGVGVAINDIGDTTIARITGVSGVLGGDVSANAHTDASIQSIAVAGGVGKTVGLAGSVGVNLMENDTTAEITGNSNLTVDGSVAVLAKTGSDIDVLAGAVGIGSTAGLAGGVELNLQRNDTVARINGGSQVDAAGGGSGFSVTTQPGSTSTLSGVLVSAGSSRDLDTIAVSVGIGGTVGIGASVPINILKDNAEAIISGGARINQRRQVAASGNQVVSVTSYNDTNLSTDAGGAGIGLSAAGIGIAVDVTVPKTTSIAYVDGSSVAAKKALTIGAWSRQDIFGKQIGFGGGYVGVAGGVEVDILKSTTQAYARNANLTSHGSLTISAMSDSHLDYLTGAGAIGLAGVAGAVGVNKITNETSAFVDGTSIINAAGAMSLTANSKELIEVEVGSGSVGLVGISASVPVNIIRSTTTARVADGVQVNQDAALRLFGQSITITASDDAKIDSNAGAITAGAVGIGGAVSVDSIKNTVLAEIGNNARVSATGDISLNATATKAADIDVIAGAGGLIGGAGSVSVLTLGGKPESDGSNRLSTAGSDIDTFVQTNDAASKGGGGSQTANKINADLNAERSSISVVSELSDATENTTTARIGNNAIVRAGEGGVGSVQVNATDNIHVSQDAGAEAVGGVSIGLGLAFVNVNTSARALIGSGATVAAADRIELNAKSQDVGGSGSFAFAGGIGLANIGGSVSRYTRNSNTLAEVGDNATLLRARDINVIARDTSDVETESGRAGLGAIQAGASFATSNNKGSTIARLGNGATVGSATDASQKAGNLTITAESSKDATAEAKSLSAGILNFNANIASATINPDASATIGSNARIYLTGDVSLNAIATPRGTTDIKGVNVISAVSVGANFSQLAARPTANAMVYDGALIDAQNFSATANAGDGANAASLISTGFAVTGGSLVGAEGLVTTATVNSTSNLMISPNVQIRTRQDINLLSTADTRVAVSSAQATGIAGISLGAIAGTGIVNRSINTTISPGAKLTAGGNLSVQALNDHLDNRVQLFQGTGFAALAKGDLLPTANTTDSAIVTVNGANLSAAKDLMLQAKFIANTTGDLVERRVSGASFLTEVFSSYSEHAAFASGVTWTGSEVSGTKRTTSSIDVDLTDLVKITGNSSIEASVVEINAQNAGFAAVSNAYVQEVGGVDFSSDGESTSYASVTINANTEVGAGVQITGRSKLNIHAVVDKLLSDSSYAGSPELDGQSALANERLNNRDFNLFSHAHTESDAPGTSGLDNDSQAKAFLSVTTNGSVTLAANSILRGPDISVESWGALSLQTPTVTTDKVYFAGRDDIDGEGSILLGHSDISVWVFTDKSGNGDADPGQFYTIQFNSKVDINSTVEVEPKRSATLIVDPTGKIYSDLFNAALVNNQIVIEPLRNGAGGGLRLWAGGNQSQTLNPSLPLLTGGNEKVDNFKFNGTTITNATLIYDFQHLGRNGEIVGSLKYQADPRLLDVYVENQSNFPLVFKGLETDAPFLKPPTVNAVANLTNLAVSTNKLVNGTDVAKVINHPPTVVSIRNLGEGDIHIAGPIDTGAWGELSIYNKLGGLVADSGALIQTNELSLNIPRRSIGASGAALPIYLADRSAIDLSYARTGATLGEVNASLTQIVAGRGAFLNVTSVQVDDFNVGGAALPIGEVTFGNASAKNGVFDKASDSIIGGEFRVDLGAGTIVKRSVDINNPGAGTIFNMTVAGGSSYNFIGEFLALGDISLLGDAVNARVSVDGTLKSGLEEITFTVKPDGSTAHNLFDFTKSVSDTEVVLDDINGTMGGTITITGNPVGSVPGTGQLLVLAGYPKLTIENQSVTRDLITNLVDLQNPAPGEVLINGVSQAVPGSFGGLTFSSFGATSGDVTILAAKNLLLNNSVLNPSGPTKLANTALGDIRYTAAPVAGALIRSNGLTLTSRTGSLGEDAADRFLKIDLTGLVVTGSALRHAHLRGVGHDLLVDGFTTGDHFKFSSDLGATVRNVIAGVDLLGETEGSVTLLTSKAGHDVNIASKTGATTLTDIIAGYDLTASAEQNVTLTNVSAQNNAKVGARQGNATLENVQAGVDLLSAARGNVTVTNSSAGNHLTLNAVTGNVTAENFVAGFDTTVTAGTDASLLNGASGNSMVVFASNGRATLEGLAAGNDITVVAQTDSTLQKVLAADTVEVFAVSGVADLDEIRAGKIVHVVTGQPGPQAPVVPAPVSVRAVLPRAAAAAVANAGDALLRNVRGVQKVLVEAAHDAKLRQVVGGRLVSVQAERHASLQNVKAGTTVKVEAEKNVTMTGVNAGTLVTALAKKGNISAHDIESGGKILELARLGSISAGVHKAGREIFLTAAQDITSQSETGLDAPDSTLTAVNGRIGGPRGPKRPNDEKDAGDAFTADTRGTLHLAAAQTIHFHETKGALVAEEIVTGAGRIVLKSAAGIEAETITGPESIHLVAAGDVDVAQLGLDLQDVRHFVDPAHQNTPRNPRNVEVGSGGLKPGADYEAKSPVEVNISAQGHGVIVTRAQFHHRFTTESATADVTATPGLGSDLLTFNVSGNTAKRGSAELVNFNVTGASDAIFENLVNDRGTISTDGNHLFIIDGLVGASTLFGNSDVVAAMNSQNSPDEFVFLDNGHSYFSPIPGYFIELLGSTVRTNGIFPFDIKDVAFPYNDLDVIPFSVEGIHTLGQGMLRPGWIITDETLAEQWSPGARYFRAPVIRDLRKPQKSVSLPAGSMH